MTWSSVAKWLTQCHVNRYVNCVYRVCSATCPTVNLTKVRNWHNLMPNVATLKNAYRDRPKKRSAGDDDLQDEDEDDNSDAPKKVPQSFTFVRREGWPFAVLMQYDLS